MAPETTRKIRRSIACASILLGGGLMSLASARDTAKPAIVMALATGVDVEDRELGLGMGDDYEWLSTEPPRFVAYHRYSDWRQAVLFEGCAPRPITDIVHGPDDVIVADDTVLQRGVVVGHVHDAVMIQFAPH